MKISILGAGAIGSMIGGLLKHHEPRWDVLLVARGDHGQAMRARGGVRLEGPWGTREVPLAVSFDAGDLAGSDYVLFCVKSQATAEAIGAAVPHLGSAIVVSLQNGINEPHLVEYVDADRLVLGVTATNMAVVEPGTVRLQLDGPTLFGPSARATSRSAAEQAVGVFRQSHLMTRLQDNIRGAQYNKLAINALGSASCLSESNFISEAITHRPWRQAVARPLLEECVEVYREARIELVGIPRRPGVRQLKRLLGQLDTPLLGRAIGCAARRIYDRQPIVFSLGQDLRRGKPTEVDYINGEIVRLAARCGRSAPYNQQVVRMVHRLEGRKDRGSFTREEVIERFRQLTAGADSSQDLAPLIQEHHPA